MPPRRTKTNYVQTTGIPVEIWTHELIPMIDVVSLWALSRTCKGFLAVAPTTRWKFRGVNRNKVSELALYAHQHPSSSLGQFIRKDVKNVLVMSPSLYEIIDGCALSAVRTSDYRLFYYAWYNGVGPECSWIINGRNVMESIRGLGSRHPEFWTALSKGDTEAYMSATMQEVLSCAPTLEQFGIFGVSYRTRKFFMEYLNALREAGLITAPHEIKIPSHQLPKATVNNIVAARDNGLLRPCSDLEKRHVWVKAVTTPEHVLAAVAQGYTIAVSDLLPNRCRIPALLPLINAQEVAKTLSYRIGDDDDGGTASAAVLAATLMLFPREVVDEATAEYALARIALGLPFDISESASQAEINRLLNAAIIYNSPAVDLLVSSGAIIDRDWSYYERCKLLRTAIKHNNLSSVKAAVASGAELPEDGLDFGAISADICEYLEEADMSVYPSSVYDLTSVDKILEVWKYHGRM